MEKKYVIIAIIFIIVMLLVFSMPNFVIGAEKEVLLLDLDDSQEIDEEDYALIFKDMVAKKTGKHPEWILENNENLNISDCLAIVRYIYASNNDEDSNSHIDWIQNLIQQVILEISNNYIELDLNSINEYSLNVLSQNCGEIQYENNNTGVCNISKNGTIVAVGKGEAIIKVADERNLVSEECKVIVEANPTSITLSEDNIDLDITNKYEEKLIATVLPNNKDTDATVYWSSSNEKVATVDEEGNVRGISNGECIITATTKNGKKENCKVKVYTTPTEISIPNSATLDMSEKNTMSLTATIFPKTANTDTNITWSSSNEKVATVDENGVITGKANGECEIKAVTGNGKEVICNLTVIGAENPSVTIERNYEGRIITAGSTAEYTIVMNGNNISNIDTGKIKLKGSMANNSKVAIKQEENKILVRISVGEGIGTLGLEIEENMLTSKVGKTSTSTEIEEDYVFTLNETTAGNEDDESACIAVAVGVHNSFYIKSYDFYLGDTKKIRK